MCMKKKHILIALAGIFCGLLLLFVYALRLPTFFIGDDPSACINCHIMSPQYVTWSHSSHYRDATCNDCHVPHENIFKKYFFKGTDGGRHSILFLLRMEHQAIRANNASAEVIMNNCIRCHKQLTTEFAKAGRMDYMMAQKGKGLACWDCHRNVPHGGMNSLNATPGAEMVVPLPQSPVPDWLQKAVGVNPAS